MSKPNREIERKYLLHALPPRTRDAPAVHIHQGYLPGDKITERVRRTVSDSGARYYRTIKAGQGIDRMEIEEAIDETFFSAVWPLTRGHRVEKRRYLVADGDLTWEIDEFLDREEFWLAEVELDAVDRKVVVPDWLREFVEREVTDEPLFTNYALSK